MKKYLLYINMLLSAFLMGCAQEEISTTFGGEKDDMVLTFTLNNTETVSRSADFGVEDEITKVDLFLYTKGSTDNAKCYREGLSKATLTSSGEGIATNGDDGATITTVTAVITSDEWKELFPSGATECDAYVIVNNTTEYTKTSGKITSTKKSDLKGIALTANFKEDQTSFVMDGEGIVKKSANSLTGDISLTRAASKITLTITEIKTATEDGEVWTAQTDGMNVYFYNGRNDGLINGQKTPVSYFNTGQYSFTGNQAPFTQTKPFYSYPSNWSSDDTNKAKEAYLVLLLPWTSETHTIPVNYYYKVPIGNTQSLERNTHYQISLKVGILGVKEIENVDDVTLTPSCILLDWNTEEEIVGDMNKAKYLVVDEKKVVIHNQKVTYVGYESSDAVSAVITSITRPDYSSTTDFKERTTTFYSNTTGNSTVGTSTGLLRQCSVSVDANTKQIILTHELVNDRSTSSYDYVPYTIKVLVTNESGFREEIIYKQYPALYIEADYNEGGDTSLGNKERGYVMVNTLYTNRRDYSDGTTGNWQTVEGFDNSSKNPNMYIITTTALDATLSSYILGDSRTTTAYSAGSIPVYNSTNTSFTSATDVKGRTLTNYYPTKTDNINYLSPRFRIASAYGQLGDNDLSHADAVKRCAAYQEAGYPAGRWRLPTYAELNYIGRLCTENKLPLSLFSTQGVSYWGATDNYELQSGSFTSSSDTQSFLRCVYDDWYWGANPAVNLTEFTWGDEPRQ